jgi:hypothetical protein
MTHNVNNRDLKIALGICKVNPLIFTIISIFDPINIVHLFVEDIVDYLMRINEIYIEIDNRIRHEPENVVEHLTIKYAVDTFIETLRVYFDALDDALLGIE